MADLNDLNKPDGTSNYSSEVWQTVRGHVTRLWSGDYTGMGNLVAGMRRWVRVGVTDAKLVQRNSSGGEDVLFDSTTKADATATATALASKAPLNGTGATGTWGINILGRATSADGVLWSGVTNKICSYSVSSFPYNITYGVGGMPVACAVLSDGRVYLCFVNSAVAINIASRAISGMASPSPSMGATSTASCQMKDGRILFIESSGAARIFNPSTNAWATAATPPYGLGTGAVVCLTDGRVYVFGGQYGGLAKSSISIYTPSTNSWTTLSATMPMALDKSKAVLMSDGTVLLVGGWGGGSFSEVSNVWVFNPSDNTFSTKANLPSARFSAGACVLPDGRVLISGGGTNAGGLIDSYIYSGLSNVYVAAPFLPYWTLFFGICVLPDGRIFFGGGVNASGNDLNSAFFFNPTI